MTLRARIMLAAMISTLLVGLVITMLVVYTKSVHQEQMTEVALTGEMNLWHKIVASQLDQMEFGVSALTRNRNALKALKADDSKALNDAVITTFRRLEASKTLTRLQVTDTSGTVLFSAPDDASGKSPSSLVVKAIEEGQIFSGLEVESDGQMRAVLAFPLYSRGKFTGVGVYSRDLQAALMDFKENNGSEAVIIDADGSGAYYTDQELLQGVMDELLAIEPGASAYLPHGDVVHYSLSQTVTDADGNPLGRLVSASDRTESYESQNRIL